MSELAKYYKESPTYKLVNLANDPEGLNLESIPVLQKELLERGEQEAALKLSEYLVESQRKASEPKLSQEDLQKELDERLAAGESIESIALKFKDNGIDVFKELEGRGQIQEKAFDYILALKDQGLADKEVNEKLQENFSLSNADADVMTQRLKTKAKTNLVIGYSMIVIFSILSVAVLANGGSVGIGGIVLTGLGIWRVVEGHSIINSLRN
jgi:hypothetical protein